MCSRHRPCIWRRSMSSTCPRSRSKISRKRSWISPRLGPLPKRNPHKEMLMPLANIALQRGKPAEYRHAISAAVHQALVEVVGIPEADNFHLITEFEIGRAHV